MECRRTADAANAAPSVIHGFYKMAEGRGFEPRKGLHPCWFSRPVHSTALPTLLRRALKDAPVFRASPPATGPDRLKFRQGPVNIFQGRIHNSRAASVNR